MTDRLKGFVVHLERDIREDDANTIIEAIKALRYVGDVRPIKAGFEDSIARSRVRQELLSKIIDLFQEQK